MDTEIGSLVEPARIALAVTVGGFVLASALALVGRDEEARRRHRPAVRALLWWTVLVGLPAAVLSLPSVASAARPLLPAGVFVGLALAVASLGWAPARRAFDALSDGQIRALLGYRATFGAFLFAGAALELVPPIFALTAGLGDLLVTWLAHAAPVSLAAGGSRGWRLVVHGWGLLDLVEVVVLAMGVVRPWLAAHDGIGPPLLLPWVGVPLMLALNLHGLRRAIADARSGASSTSGDHDAASPRDARAVADLARRSAAVDGSQPLRGLRGALGRA